MKRKEVNPRAKRMTPGLGFQCKKGNHQECFKINCICKCGHYTPRATR